MNERGQYGNYTAQSRAVAQRRSGSAAVGLELPGTSYANVAQLNSAIVSFARAVVTACGADPMLVPSSNSPADIQTMYDYFADKPDSAGFKGIKGHIVDSQDAIKKAGKLGVFWLDEGSPFLSEWQNFSHDHSHWYDFFSQLGTNAEVYQTWQARLNALRDKAKKLGVKLPTDQVGIPQSHGLIDDFKGLLGTAGWVIGGIVLAGGIAYAIAEGAKKHWGTP
jgi:hypothetical protein